MIVADANLLMHLVIRGEHTASAETVHERDSDWVVPPIALSEARNVLTTLVRSAGLSRAHARTAYAEIVSLIGEAVVPVDGAQVLELAWTSSCSAYDAEYVAVARLHGVPLVTSDRRLLAIAPDVARHPAQFAGTA